MKGSWPPVVRVFALVAIAASLPAHAHAQTATTPGTLSSYSTIHSIGIEWQVAGDTDHDATATIQYRPAAGGDWRQGLAPLRVDYNGFNLVAGSLFFLSPDTEYLVRVSLADPDGGADAREVRVRTRRLPAPPSGGRVFHVVPGGGGGSGTANDPFRGVAAAEAVAGPGDTFLLHGGNYGGRIVFNAGGTPDAYVAWRAAGDGEVTMAGIDIVASHLWLEGLTIRNQQYGTRTLDAPTNVVITRSFFYDNLYGIFLSGGGSYWYIADNTIAGNMPVWTESFDGEGIELLYTDGHTVAHNSITSAGDGISYPRTNVDIFGNDIFDTSDDGIELDFGQANVRVWGNRIHNPHHNGISFQPQVGGPWYIIRNQIVGGDEAPLKFRTTDRFVLLHNTMVSWDWLFCCQVNDMQKAFSRNNLWVSGSGGQMLALLSSARDWRTSLDYDGFDWGTGLYPFIWDGTIHYSVESFAQASGHYRNGIQIFKESCFEDFQMYGQAPTSVPAHRMSLRSTCNAVDAGVPLPNINDGFAGGAPDMGAHEYGGATASYGPRSGSDSGGGGGTGGGSGNALPTVSLTSPSTGASFTAPASLTISAAASDSDGTVARVDFFANGSLVASDSSAPYTVSWSSVPAGAYTVTAQATDSAGGVSTSAAVHVTVQAPPSTSLPPLPSGWSHQDVGSVALSGSSSYESGTYTVRASGVDVWDTSDEFRFSYQTLTGDGSIVARVDTLSGSDPWAKAGVMMRASLAGGSPHAFMLVTPSYNGLAFQRRVSSGGISTHTPGGSGNAPAWVRLVRVGDRITASHSFDGSTWTVVGSDTIAMDATLYVGLAVTSHDAGALAEATFSQVHIETGLTPAPSPEPAPGSGLPEGWTAQDIGSVGVPGSLSVGADAWTLRASGADIWDTTDGFHFGYRALSGDGSIVARVSDVLHTHEWAKAGLMMRSGLSPGAAHGFILLTPDGSRGVAFQRRTVAGGVSTHTDGGYASGPVWLKLARAGDTLIASRSADGSSWTEVGRDTIPMGTTIYVGVAATSHEHSLLGSATFESVVLTEGASAGGGAWSSHDIGPVGALGTATQTSSGWAVTGSGADIWDTSDAFRYVYRSMSGDFTITTRVASVDYVDQWTKAGLMVRASTASASAHVSLFATPTAVKGVAFQRRHITSGWSVHTAGPSLEPGVWLRLTRTGGTITAYYRRSEGESWTTIGSESSAALGSSVLVGLAVTSHADGSLATAVFDNVTFP